MAKRLEIKVSATIPDNADAFAESDLITAAKEHVTALKDALKGASDTSEIAVEVKVVSPPEHRKPRATKNVTTGARTARAAA